MKTFIFYAVNCNNNCDPLAENTQRFVLKAIVKYRNQFRKNTEISLVLLTTRSRPSKNC